MQGLVSATSSSRRETIRNRALARAARLAEASRDPVERHTAMGLVQMARRQGRAAERSLLRALAIDPGFEEALSALILLQEDAIASGRSHVSPSPRLLEDPAAAVIEGWRGRGAGDGRRVRALEPRLAAIAPRHPLFPAATRLRVEWRIASHEATLAAEGVDLLEPLLVPPRPEDLLLRARSAVVARRPRLALAAISEAMPLGSRPALAEKARAILEALAGQGVDEWRQRLLSQLERRVQPEPPSRNGRSGRT